MQDSMIILLLTLLAAFYAEAVVLYFFITTKSFIKNSLKTKAKVVDVEQVKSGKDLRLKLLVVFKDQLNQEVSAKINGTGLKSCNKGDEVEILYLKNDPQKAKINDFSAIYTMFRLVSMMSAFLVVVAIARFLTEK